MRRPPAPPAGVDPGPAPIIWVFTGLSARAFIAQPGPASAEERTVSEPSDQEPASPAKELSPAAKRALAEAEERRRLADAQRQPRPTELNGQAGPEPTRYGDWEKGGIVSDF